MIKTVIATLQGHYTVQDLRGEPHIVVPTTALVEGVLPAEISDNSGPTLILGQELKKSVDKWNGMPLLIDHPNINESARSPAIANKQEVGQIFNARIRDNNKLIVDAWIRLNAAKSNEELQGIINDIKDGVVRDVSVGFSAKFQYNKGTYNNVAFNTVSLDLQPDHLAIMTKGVSGACSPEQGCGLANTYAHKTGVTNCGCTSCVSAATSNTQLNMETNMSQNYVLLTPNGSAGNANATTGVQDNVIMGDASKLGLPVTMIPVTTAPFVNPAAETATKEAVAPAPAAAEAPAAVPMQQPQFYVIQVPTAPAPVEAKAKVEEEEEKEEEVKANKATAPTALEIGITPTDKEAEWLANAPERFVSIITEALTTRTNARNAAVEAIQASASNKFTSEQLNGMDSETLIKIQGMLTPTDNSNSPAAQLAAALGSTVEKVAAQDSKGADIVPIPSRNAKANVNANAADATATKPSLVIG